MPVPRLLSYWCPTSWEWPSSRDDFPWTHALETPPWCATRGWKSTHGRGAQLSLPAQPSHAPGARRERRACAGPGGPRSPFWSPPRARAGLAHGAAVPAARTCSRRRAPPGPGPFHSHGSGAGAWRHAARARPVHPRCCRTPRGVKTPVPSTADGHLGFWVPVWGYC